MIIRKEFYNNELEEQETIINVLYKCKEVSIYTSRKTIYKRLKEKLGEASELHFTKNKISGASWNIPFDDIQKLRVVFSRPTIIGKSK